MTGSLPPYTPVAEVVAGRLCAEHLGQKVSVVYDGVLIVGTLRGADHTLRYDEKPQTYMHVLSDDGWRWGKFVPSSEPVTLYSASPLLASSAPDGE